MLGEVLEISLQRTLPSASSGREPPPSYSRAPLAADQEVVLAGLGPGEILWIGFQPLPRVHPDRGTREGCAPQIHREHASRSRGAAGEAIFMV